MESQPKCRVYLLRHGEVANAQEPCFNGHHDVDLSPRGVEQIRQVAETLKDRALRAVYSSDLRRTVIGAEILAEPHGLKAIPCRELRELSVGVWDGLTVREVNRRFPGQYDERMKNLETFHVEGGETFFQLRDRVIPEFNKIVSRHPGDTIAIVGHGGVNRMILSHLLGFSIKHLLRIEQRYAAVNVIQFYEADVVLELINGSCGSIP